MIPFVWYTRMSTCCYALNFRIRSFKASMKSHKMNSNKQYNLPYHEKSNSKCLSLFVLFTCSVVSFSLIYFSSSKFLIDATFLSHLEVKLDFGEKASVKDDLYAKNTDECAGKYILMQDVPSKFNLDLLKNCSTLNPWTSMCKPIQNSGFGPQVNGSSWYATHQFSLEVMFHKRMKQYKCLTNDSSKASAIYVPYYAGLDVGRYLWTYDLSVRDADSISLVKLIQQKPEWKKMWGRDHFLVAGRVSWDFRRGSDVATEWGGCLFSLPGVKNMTSLVIESSPWNNSDIAIPYPTSFHPSSDHEVLALQDKMRRKRRPYLFSFAGAPRPQLQQSMRNEIINQCIASKAYCKLLRCSEATKNCDDPGNLMRLFQKSVFCLQPTGDSFTRRSTFDAILAGCIPIFLHPSSAYVQYLWYLPKNYTRYSIFIPTEEFKYGNFSIEKRLLEIPKEEVQAMREEVIRLIPNIVYANPNSTSKSFEDAFDVAIKGVLNHVKTIRTDMEAGRNLTLESYPEDYTWKYNFFGNLENKEWDRYFNRTK